ncbi:MAG: DpnI domain-containing protein [Hyphomonas sp.]|uniref:DpnI domain-containing protein n=1 Tax=Hyphomonas sp. TaxID=87 RepID=UPI0035286585
MREERAVFASPSQNARAMTEDWARHSLFCPSCSSESLSAFPANRPVADLFCEKCEEEFELKSQSRPFGRKVVDGAYGTMVERLQAANNPSLILLHYHRQDAIVENVLLIPKFHFSLRAIEKRKPLAPTARRAGWVGCNILLDQIPGVGKIPIMTDGKFAPSEIVRRTWQSTAFLKDAGADSRGWLLATMQCVEQVRGKEFSLSEIYEHEAQLGALFPENNNIRPKLRQQLQVMRDRGLLEFLGKGRYRKRLLS